MADRHPLRRYSVLAGVVGLAVAVAVQLGIGEGEAAEWQKLALQALDIAVVAGIITRGGEEKATPLADPRDDAGRPLRVKGSGGPQADPTPGGNG
jgi:hypothetical protein